MNVQQLQAELVKLKHDTAGIDGIAGSKTMAAVDKVLEQSGAVNWSAWPDARRRVGAEQYIMRDIYGIEVGEVDGLVGEQTRYARTVFEGRLKNNGKPDPKVENWRDHEKPVAVPKGKPHEKWPKQKDVQKFYGKPGSGFTMITLPFQLRLAWAPSTTLSRVSVHGKCADAFLAVWRNAHQHYGMDELRRLRLDMFGGSANVRKMRGGSKWSMHAFACAWDVDPDRNQLKWGRAKASLDGPEYVPFWNIVYEQGGLSLGRERDYDWMHFQFTRDFS
jgi:hypothetical protein